MKNNDKQIKNLLERIPGIALTESERDEMKKDIRQYVEGHPIPEQKFSWATLFRTVVAPALFCIAVIGGGVLAAEGAMPGDVLYPVKVSVNEQIRAAFVSTPEGEARLESEILQRRLAEVEQLAAENQLDARIRLDLERRVQSQINEAQEQIKKLERNEELNDIKSELNATLRIHGRILKSLSDRSTTTQEQVREVLRSVEEEVAAEVSEIEEGEDVDAQEDRALLLQATAENRIKETEERMIQVDDEFSETVKEFVQEEMEQLQKMLSDANAELEREEYRAAARQYEIIIEKAIDLRERINAHARLKIPSITEELFAPVATSSATSTPAVPLPSPATSTDAATTSSPNETSATSSEQQATSSASTTEAE